MSVVRTPVDVAAGVLIRPDGRFLLASRPVGKPYALYWEFPGGKVEAGEPVVAALARELREELAIEIGPAFPWVVRTFDYPHALVRLHFFRIFAWGGQLQAREQQRFGFFSPGVLPEGPLLPATIPVLRWLSLPSLYAISAAAKLGTGAFLRRLDSALARGLRLVQFREPTLSSADAASIFDQVVACARAVGAKVLVNSRHARTLWDKADGVHLTAADAAALKRRPDYPWVAASVHSILELRHAAEIDVDFVVAGPVCPTSSHPTSETLGWPALAQLISETSAPAFALGGLRSSDVSLAVRHGAHGIASLSAVWNEDQCVNFEESALMSTSFGSESPIE